jgi:hypothetical protein
MESEIGLVSFVLRIGGYAAMFGVRSRLNQNRQTAS